MPKKARELSALDVKRWRGSVEQALREGTGTGLGFKLRAGRPMPFAPTITIEQTYIFRDII